MRARHWLWLFAALVFAGAAKLGWEIYDNQRDRAVQVTIGDHHFAVPSRLINPGLVWSHQRKDGQRDYITFDFDISDALPEEAPTADHVDRVRQGRSLHIVVDKAQTTRSEFFARKPQAIGMHVKLRTDPVSGLDVYTGRGGFEEVLVGHSDRLAGPIFHSCSLEGVEGCAADTWYGADLELRYVLNRRYLDRWHQVLTFLLDTLASFEAASQGS